MNGASLFSWIHVSDIHFGHGDERYLVDQDLVANRLLDDVRAMKQFVPHPDAIFVTGDIAFSGGATNRRKLEYGCAKEFLTQLGGESGVPPAHIFTVPGNHDVQRTADADEQTSKLVARLRAGDESLDAAFVDPLKKEVLSQRLANYLRFARDFGPHCRSGNPPELCWEHPLDKGAIKVRIVGLNTALLCADDADRGQLRLSPSQLKVFTRRASDPELLILLSHHPFAGGWLADERDSARLASSLAHIHLSGHVHEHLVNQIRNATGSTWLEISAGAAHRDPTERAGEADQTYSLGAVVASKGGLRIKVWPRRWSHKTKRFVASSEDVMVGYDHSLHWLSIVPESAGLLRRKGPKRFVPRPFVERLTGTRRPNPSDPVSLARHGVAHLMVGATGRAADGIEPRAHLMKGGTLLGRALVVFWERSKVKQAAPA